MIAERGLSRLGQEFWGSPGRIYLDSLKAADRVHWFCDHMPETGIFLIFSLRVPNKGDGNMKTFSFELDFGNQGHRNLLRGINNGIHIAQTSRDYVGRLKEFMIWVVQLKD